MISKSETPALESEKVSKREELKKANKQQILNAALKVFGESGLDGANVRDIIRASELSPGTFYNYFQSKEEVFDYLLDEIIQDIHNKSRTIWMKAWQGGDAMKSAFEEFFNSFQDRPDYLLFFAKNQQYVRALRYNGKITGILDTLEADIAQAIKEGKIPPFPVKFITVLLFGTVFEFLADLVFYPDKVSIPQISEYLASFFRGGILFLSLQTAAKDTMSSIFSIANFPVELASKLIQSFPIK